MATFNRTFFSAAFLAALVVCIPAHAGDTIGLHVASVHSEPGFNNVNPGVYYRHNGFTVGAYYNSMRRLSTYAGYTIETSGRVTFALTAGVVTGYPSRPIQPLLIPSVAYHFNSNAVRIAFIPPAIKHGVAALHLMVEHKFD